MSLRIIHFYKHFLCEGGMPRETLLLAKAMSRYAEVEVYCLSPKINAEEINTVISGVKTKVFRVPKILYDLKWSLWLPPSLITALQENPPDIVLLIGSFIGEHYPLSRKLLQLRIPYIISIGEAFNPFTFHGFKRFKKTLWYMIYEKKVIIGARAVRIYSEEQKEHLKKWGLSPTCIVIKEGIDWENIPHEFRSAPTPGVKQNPPIFGFLGRLDIYKKGIDVLLEGFKLYKEWGGTGILKIAGPPIGDSLRQVKKLIVQSKLYNTVTLEGPKFGSEKFDFLKSITCLCVPSRHEGIPRVIRESLAVGCPVMVTPGTNMHDIVGKYKCGLVINMNSYIIARALQLFDVLSESERISMSLNALQAAYNLNWDQIAREYVEKICEIIHL